MIALTALWFNLLTGLVCDPVWLPISRSSADLYFVATVTAVDSGLVRARVLQASDGGAALRGREVVLVPWAYSSDCSPLPWGTAEAWQPPSGAAFYTGQLRAGERVPTVDVHMAWREPLWRDHETRWPHPVPDEDLLTAAEFYEVYAALPLHEEIAKSPDKVAARIDAWVKAHQELSRREPAVTMLANLRRALTVRP